MVDQGREGRLNALPNPETKIIEISKQKVLLVGCRCNVCERCWFRTDRGECLYGGPFEGYEHI